MNPKREQVVLAGLCLLVMLLSLAGLVWAFLTGLLYPHLNMDGLLLVLICLTMAGVFKLMFFSVAKSAGWFDAYAIFRRKKAAPNAAAKKTPAPTGDARSPGEPR